MLQKVSIQNFKSLKDVTLELQKVNLLIGPNNSGKSNFLKALEFVGSRLNDFHNDEISNYTFNHEIEKELRIHLIKKIGDNDLLGKYRVFTYLNNNSKPAGRGAIVEVENINMLDNYIGNYMFPLDSEFVYKNVQNEKKGDWTDFRNDFADSILYSINPNKLQKPFPILPNNSFVKYDASNLVAFLDLIQGRYRDNFVAIENDLNKCIPEFSRIELESVEITKDEDLFKIYGDKTFKRLGLYNDEQKQTYWADEVSEGVLYFLALLCIIHQPNPPKLLLLEEPEKGIHPRRIKEVLDFIFQLAEDKDIQVIMTTHSERVLDEFEDIPEAVFIFDKDEEGATQVKNLLKDVIEPSNKVMEENNAPKIKFTESLGSHWVTGFIGGVPR
jgi:predicted ATPase